MSKKFVSILFASALLLVACGDEEVNTADEVGTVDDVTEETKSEVVNEDFKNSQSLAEDSLEIDKNQPLENIGEYKYVIDGRVELIDIVRPAETYTLIDDVEIDFKDIKIIHLSEIPESEKEFVRNTYGFDDEGYTIQFGYSVKNKTDSTVGGIEIQDIVTSNGNQYNLYNDGGPTMDSSYEVRPQATTNVGVVFSIENPNIDNVTLYFQPLDSEGWHLDEAIIELFF